MLRYRYLALRNRHSRSVVGWEYVAGSYFADMLAIIVEDHAGTRWQSARTVSSMRGGDSAKGWKWNLGAPCMSPLASRSPLLQITMQHIAAIVFTSHMVHLLPGSTSRSLFHNAGAIRAALPW